MFGLRHDGTGTRAKRWGTRPVMPTPDGAGTAAPADAASATVSNRLADLDDLGRRPLAEHAEIYQALHADLQAALAEIDSA
jgi:hypothetical protein